ncbi:MAG: carbamoyltransferase [Fimbriimonadaceae bacterium]|nr:carbamoyltransferase [Fimbriimonadaceae bacterium]
MLILGISCYYHDAAAVLLQDGRLVAAAEEERFSRRKHDSGFPLHAVRFCLRTAGVRLEDVDYVVFYEKPLLKFDRILRTALATWPRSLNPFREAMLVWLGDKLWMRSDIRRHLPVPAAKVLFVEHHLSHAASALYSAPFESAALLTVDGVGEWTTTATGQGTGAFTADQVNRLELTHEIRFPHSLGLLYSAFTAWLGFEVNEGEYKVMGMAPYGQPRYVDKVRQVIRVESDGSFALDLSYFTYHHSATQTFSPKLVALLGEPRPREADFYTADTPERPDDWSPEYAAQCQYYADVAASIQAVTEETILSIARHLRQRTGERNLVLAGGVALNSVANGRVLTESGFEQVYIQPAAGDSGGALGAALYAYHVLLGGRREFVMEHAYWGAEYSTADTEAFLQRESIAYRAYDDDALSQQVAGLLDQQKVVGWFQGRFEWGPRALGNRSILADARPAAMKRIVNEKIKFREPFRPFAPAVLEEATTTFFDCPDPRGVYPLRFMLMVRPVQPAQREVIAATTHQDGSGRLQTVRREWNQRYHDLLAAFGERTGVPVILNTSFNLRGEPIVNTPANAYNTFMNSDMDALVLGNLVVRKGGA